MTINILNKPNLIIPKRANKEDLGYDVVATSEPNVVGDFIEFEGQKLYQCINYIEYDTDLQIAPQKDVNWRGVERKFHTFVFPRSSVSKYNLLLANSIGLIDNPYRNSIKLRFKYIYQPEDLVFGKDGFFTKLNHEKIYKKGDKICQLVAYKNIDIDFEVVNTLDETSRNMGGFGSSGS